jgi:hypothetical protein
MHYSPIHRFRRRTTLVPVTWNPLDKTASCTLSNGDKTATAGATDQAVRGNVGKSSGKWYFELVQGSNIWNSAGAIPFGISKAAFLFGAANIGVDANSAGVNTNLSDYRFNGSSTGGNPDPGDFSSAGGVLMVAFDADAGHLWFGLNGTWGGIGGVTGNPGAGTGACITGIGAGPWYPTVTNSASGDIIHLYASLADCAYAPPSGFSYWSG